MIIESEFGNDYYGNLIIQNYPNLQSIIMKKKSLQNLNSLKICNCEKLKIMKVEDSESCEEYYEYYEYISGKEKERGTLYFVKTVIFKSISFRL